MVGGGGVGPAGGGRKAWLNNHKSNTSPMASATEAKIDPRNTNFQFMSCLSRHTLMERGRIQAGLKDDFPTTTAKAAQDSSLIRRVTLPLPQLTPR